MYDPPFELYAGDYAFSYPDERPNELLALFTERDRRPASQPEESDPYKSKLGAAHLDDSVSKKANLIVKADSGGSNLGSGDHVVETPLGEPKERNTDMSSLGQAQSCIRLETEDLASEDPYTEETYSEKAYDVPVPIMRERLEIMGFSNARWRRELQDYVRPKIVYAANNVEKGVFGAPERKKAEKRLMIMQRSSLRRWMKKWLLLRDQWLNQSYSIPEDTLMYEMYDKHYGVEPIFTRELIALRAALEALDDDEIVSLRFSNAVYEEETVAEDEALSETARFAVLRSVREFDPILVLTEGRTDARIICESFKRMRPEIAHMFSYMDHEAFKVPGGTPALVGLARSLAGAKISNRIIFLFDNDAAGHEGYQQFQKVNCPNHFQGMILPYLKSAEAYPTIGPTGVAPANVNGCACGIELYCGSRALTSQNGGPCPVQWKGYMEGMKRYQGEPLDKDGIKERFLSALKQSNNPRTDPEFEDMRLVLKALTKVRWN